MELFCHKFSYCILFNRKHEFVNTANTYIIIFEKIISKYLFFKIILVLNSFAFSFYKDFALPALNIHHTSMSYRFLSHYECENSFLSVLSTERADLTASNKFSVLWNGIFNALWRKFETDKEVLKSSIPELRIYSLKFEFSNTYR